MRNKETDILLNQSTQMLLQSFIDLPSHSLLIEGPNGAGKEFTAIYTAAGVLGISLNNLLSNPSFIKISPEVGKDQLGIDSIRKLKDRVKLKTVGQNRINRVIFIDRADTMTTEAQNALLKTLEEPSQDSLIVLTASEPDRLLPTIKSRVQKITVKPVSYAQAAKYFDESDEPELRKMWALSGGYAGLLSALLNKDSESLLIGAIEQAKDILKAPVYARLLKINGLSADKPELNQLLEGLGKVLAAGQSAAASKNNRVQTTKFLSARKALYTAKLKQKANCNPKLYLLELFTSLG